MSRSQDTHDTAQELLDSLDGGDDPQVLEQVMTLGRPISARKDTVVYRALKFVRRHRLGLTLSAATLVVIAILSGFLIERQMAEHARTRLEARQAEQVAAFFEGLFDVARPGPGEGETLGANHPDVAAGLNTLGALYSSQGRLDEARIVYRRVLTIVEGELGPEHPHLAVVLINLANVAAAQGKPADAIAMGERAVSINEQALGKEHTEVAHCRRVQEAHPLVTALQATGYAHPDLESAWEKQLPQP